MAADLPAVAVAVRDLYQRRHRGRASGWSGSIGRILYVLGYARAVKDRGPGFAIQALAAIALWVGAFGAIVWRMVQA